MKNFLLVSALTMAFTGAARAEINFASGVPASQKKMLAQDMFYLANQPYPSDAKLMQLMRLGGNDGLTILNWVDNRMSRIIPEDFNLESSIAVVSQSYFPPDTENPVIPTVVKTPDAPTGGTGPVVKTVMTNVGGAIYVSGKMNHMLFGINVDGKRIDVTSPRIGIFKVGAGLFDSKTLLGLEPESIVSRFFRLSTLIHEARHSDGHGASAGFLHAVCPAGHRLEGYAGCDANSNGPYSIEGQFLKVAIQNCKDCQPGDLEMLNKLAADSFGRVAAPTPTRADAELNATLISSYQMLLDLCKRTPGSCSQEDLQKYQSIVSEAQGKSATSAATAPLWDATPEGVFPTISRDQTWADIYGLSR